MDKISLNIEIILNFAKVQEFIEHCQELQKSRKLHLYLQCSTNERKTV